MGSILVVFLGGRRFADQAQAVRHPEDHQGGHQDGGTLGYLLPWQACCIHGQGLRLNPATFDPSSVRISMSTPVIL